jgi:molybdopterin synthase catalytic subunit
MSDVARVKISISPLSMDEASAYVARPDAGGLAFFVGAVRDTNEGRHVTLLEYEVYEALALAEMHRICDAVEAEIPEVRVAAHHRVGALRVGDAAVICAASAPHRGEAFRACRMLIDRIKATVPIWKREHGPDGPYWVGWVDARCDGEHGDRDGDRDGDREPHGHGHG